jgi:pseudouridine kinase
LTPSIVRSVRRAQPEKKLFQVAGNDNPVLVIGASGVDIVGHLREGLVQGASSPAEIRTSFGGVARNVAENLASLGQPVTLLTAVGQDQSGDQLIRQAASTGIDVSRVIVSSDHPTSSYLAVLDKTGEVLYALDDMHAIGALSSKAIRKNADLFKQSSLLFIDANLSSSALRTIISLAKRSHLPICADPATASLAHRLLPFLNNFYLVTPNSAEAAVLCDFPPYQAVSRKHALEAAKLLVSRGVEISIVALGEYGVCYATSETSGRVPALRTKVVDPTGAGDALTASVIFGLLNDIPLDEAVCLGVSAASLTLNYSGAVVPDLTLEKLYDHLVI